MSDVTINDYKIMYLDGTEESVDTSLSLEREYSFNFLRKDYFELLVFPNMGEAFNKLGYDFHDQFFTPQMGASVKHFSYFEKGDVKKGNELLKEAEATTGLSSDNFIDSQSYTKSEMIDSLRLSFKR